MNSDDLNSIESQRQALLGQLTAAETALRAGLNNTRGFGDIARVHAEKHLGTLILDEAWVSEIHVVPLDSSRLSASPQPASAKPA